MFTENFLKASKKKIGSILISVILKIEFSKEPLTSPLFSSLLAFGIHVFSMCLVASVASDSLRPYGLYTPAGSWDHEILQEWVAMPSSRSSQPRTEPISPALPADSLPLSRWRSRGFSITYYYYTVNIFSLLGSCLGSVLGEYTYLPTSTSYSMTGLYQLQSYLLMVTLA